MENPEAEPLGTNRKRNMSRIKQILELSSPSMFLKSELIHGKDQNCNYCSSNGWFWGDDKSGEAVKVPCPICAGSGLVHPVITIEWEPSVNRIIEK